MEIAFACRYFGNIYVLFSAVPPGLHFPSALKINPVLEMITIFINITSSNKFNFVCNVPVFGYSYHVLASISVWQIWILNPTGLNTKINKPVSYLINILQVSIKQRRK